MHYYLIAPTKIFRQGHAANFLTYASETELSAGQLVLIPLGKTTLTGLVIKDTTKPDFPTKSVLKLIYQKPLPHHLLQSALWLSDYYACPLPLVLQSLLPAGLTIKRRQRGQPPKTQPTHSHIPLNKAQTKIVQAFNHSLSSTLLLHGITGSGKTNIYLTLAQQTAARQQSTIILVPEIALSSQLIAKATAYLPNVHLIHSKQSASERHQTWEKLHQSTEPKIVIGPRSALFAPLDNIGLIIIDEAHEPAYVQDQNPKYSALRLASYMAKKLKIKTLFGSATPLIQDYYLAKTHKALLELPTLALPNQKTSTIKIIDLKNRPQFTRHPHISNALIQSIDTSLSQKLQSLIFHNRRGSAPLSICDHCGWQALCPSCLLPLTLHADQFQLICHTCGHHSKVPLSCPSCGHASIIHKGFGTKYLEQEFKKLFPKARIARFDADTASDMQLHKIYDQVKTGAFDILIGTQMIAKGFDFPRLRTLGVVQADSQLSLPDFSSEERCYQLINQVIGRASRGHQAAEIFIQSYQPDAPAIALAASSNYQAFYRALLQKRRLSHLPPFSYLLKLSLTYKTESAVIKNIRQLRQDIQAIIGANLQKSAEQILLSTPAPAFHEHTPSGYTWTLTVRAKSRQDLLAVLQNLPPKAQLKYQLDPLSLL